MSAVTRSPIPITEYLDRSQFRIRKSQFLHDRVQEWAPQFKFGAREFMIQSTDQIKSALKLAFDTPGPVLVAVHVDSRDNHKLFEEVNETTMH